MQTGSLIASFDDKLNDIRRIFQLIARLHRDLGFRGMSITVANTTVGNIITANDAKLKGTIELLKGKGRINEAQIEIKRQAHTLMLAATHEKHMVLERRILNSDTRNESLINEIAISLMNTEASEAILLSPFFKGKPSAALDKFETDVRYYKNKINITSSTGNSFFRSFKRGYKPF